MLVFLDEAGDTGFKFDTGSSKYFTIALIIFNDHEEAEKCDQRIELLKWELGKNPWFEFHYAKSSNDIKSAFFNAVSPYGFFYYGIVINKQELYSENLRIKDSFYKYVSSLVFENAKDKIDKAHVIVDKSGSGNFEKQFATYLRRKFNEQGEKKIKKVKMQDSRKNNLLQLADFVASAINRRYTRVDKSHYMEPIVHREMNVQFRPKGKSTPIQ